MFEHSGLVAIERVTQGVAVIDTNHAQVHAGNAFRLSTEKDGLANAGVYRIGIYVPDDTLASVTIDMANALADLTYTAKEVGPGGSLISVTHTDPGGNDEALAVSVVGNAIDVSLATSAEGAIISTAAEVKAAIEASAEASALVTVSDEGDGSGVVEAKTETFLYGGALDQYVHFQALTFDVILSNLANGYGILKLYRDVTPHADDQDQNANFEQSLEATACLSNRNLINGRSSNLNIKTGCGAFAGGTLFGRYKFPASGSGQRVIAGNSGGAEGIEWVLKKGANYVFEITMTGGAGTADISTSLDWYEETGG